MSNYDFCLFRIPNDGGRVLWEITNTCNYKCIYCIFSSNNKRIINELNFEEVKRVMIELKEKEFKYIKFTGGEPFIREDMIDILEYGKYLGFNMDISTNASLINDKIANRLKEIEFPMVHISLDGYNKKTHEILRGENTFERTINGIKSLRKFNVYTRIGTVIYKENENRLEDLIKLAVSLNSNEIIFSFMEAVGRLSGDDTMISKRSIKEVKKELDLLSDKYSKNIKISYSFNENKFNININICPAIQKFIYINNLGQVSPCTWVVEKYPYYKSKLTLKNNSLKEILESNTIKKYKYYLSKNKIKGCPVNRREQ